MFASACQLYSTTKDYNEKETEAEFVRTQDSLQLGRRLLEDMKGEHKEKVGKNDPSVTLNG